MKGKLRNIAISVMAFVCLLCAFGIVGCSNNQEKFELSDSVITLAISEKKEITVLGVDDISSVVWEIVDTGIATVKEGEVTAVSSGRTVLKVTYKDESLRCLIIVSETQGLPVLNVDITDVRLFTGQTLIRDAYVIFNGQKVNGVEVFFSSDNDSVVSYENGIITANGKGTATLTVTASYLEEDMLEYINVEVVDYMLVYDKFNFDLYTAELDGRYSTSKELEGALVTADGTVSNAQFNYSAQDDNVSISGNVVSVVGGFTGTQKLVKIAVTCTANGETYDGELNLTINKSSIELDSVNISTANSPVIEVPTAVGNTAIVLVGDTEWQKESIDGKKIYLKEESPFGKDKLPYDKETEIKVVDDTVIYKIPTYVYTLYIDDESSMKRFVEIGQSATLQERYSEATIAFGTNINYGMEMLNGLFGDVAFNGTIDGKGYSISNFTTKIGPFRSLGKKSIIKNLGLINVHVVQLEQAKGFNLKIASGVFGSNEGTISDCYFDINVSSDCLSAGAIGAVSSLRDQVRDTGTISNCIIKSKFDASLLSRTAATGAFVAVQEGGSTSNNFFISNYPKLSAYDNATVPTSEEDLLNSIANFGLNGSYWHNGNNEVPRLIHMDAVVISVVTELDGQFVGRNDTAATIDVTGVSDAISKVTIDDAVVQYQISGKTLTLNGNVFKNCGTNAKLKVFAGANIYMINLEVVDLVIRSKTDVNTLVEWGTGTAVNQQKYANSGIVFGENVDFEGGEINGLFKDVPFNGYIDGCGYVLNNVKTKVGLFRRLGSNAVIKNAGFTNVKVVGVETSNAYATHKLASGIFGENLGSITNCYFNIEFTVECYEAGATLYGGLSTLRDYSTGHGTGNISKCILVVNFADEILSVANAGAAFSCNDNGNWGGSWDNYVVTNIGRAWRTSDVNYTRNTYLTETELLSAVTDFGFTADCWKIESGKLPVMKNM